MFKYKFYEFYNSNKDCRSIKCASSYEGKNVSAVADLHPGDEYDVEIGKEIARLRCEQKLLKRKRTRFRRKIGEVISIIEDMTIHLNRLAKRVNAYKETVEETEVKMQENKQKLEELINKIG